MSICSISKYRNTEEPVIFRKKILDWYDVHRRVLPWRALKGEKPDPYRVWLSEIMLQQTTVQAVIPYFLKFTEKWPDVHSLAHADNDDVMGNWAGLGYYARARNLHKCAEIISSEYNGIFPTDLCELKRLPGIGDYTSAAIASIAFDQPAIVVDGNVERVMARLHACEVALPKGKKNLKAYATTYADGFDQRTGDYAQALMDLGATICTPKSPACFSCPLNDVCMGYSAGNPERYPLRSLKKKRPERHGFVYFITNPEGDILIHKRPEKGLLGGMYGLPTSEWVGRETNLQHINFLNEKMELHVMNANITHVFTHFHLTLTLYSYAFYKDLKVPIGYEWMNADRLDRLGLPTVFKKAQKFFG
ncbi:MAG: A/G-specific adenine glycosylase [Zetaproteobacteria bacterium]|nr:MAG: A/G-specific adenine glycosylase [Zetaproteobacteria bacterium]